MSERTALDRVRFMVEYEADVADNIRFNENYPRESPSSPEYWDGYAAAMRVIAQKIHAECDDCEAYVEGDADERPRMRRLNERIDEARHEGCTPATRAHEQCEQASAADETAADDTTEDDTNE